jgi:hypothetical protein
MVGQVKQLKDKNLAVVEIRNKLMDGEEIEFMLPAMYGNKNIGIVFIGYFAPFFQLHKFIALPCINNFNVGQVLFYVIAEFQGYFQGYVFFARMFSQSTLIFAPVSGINNHRADIGAVLRKKITAATAGQKENNNKINNTFKKLSFHFRYYICTG